MKDAAALINILQKFGEYLPVQLVPQYEFPLDKTLLEPDKLRLQSAFVHELKHYYQLAATTWGAHFTYAFHNSNLMMVKIFTDSIIPYFHRMGQRVPVPLTNVLQEHEVSHEKSDLLEYMRPYLDFMEQLYFDFGTVEKVVLNSDVFQLPQVDLDGLQIRFGTLHLIEGTARIEDRIRRFDKPNYYGTDVRYDFLLDYVRRWQLPNPELIALICSDIALNPPINIMGASSKPEPFSAISPPYRFILAINICHELLKEKKLPSFNKPISLQWRRAEIEGYYSHLISLICNKGSWQLPINCYESLFSGDLQYLTQQQIEFYRKLLGPIKIMRKTYPSSIAITTICEDHSEINKVSPPGLIYKDQNGLTRFLSLLDDNDRLTGYWLDYNYLLDAIVRQLLYGKDLCKKGHLTCPFCKCCGCQTPNSSILAANSHKDECSFTVHFANDETIKDLDLEAFRFPTDG